MKKINHTDLNYTNNSKEKFCLTFGLGTDKATNIFLPGRYESVFAEMDTSKDPENNVLAFYVFALQYFDSLGKGIPQNGISHPDGNYYYFTGAESKRV